MIVLVGDPLACCLTAATLTETHGTLPLLILEDTLQAQRSRSWTQGPLPSCVTSVQQHSRFLRDASMLSTRSSVMFLDTVQRHQAAVLRVETPVVDKVSIRPSPHVSNLVMYHPDKLERHLKLVLRTQGNCTFAVRRAGSSLLETLEQLMRDFNERPLVFKISTEVHTQLPLLPLSQVTWVGLNDWRLPDKLMLLSTAPKVQWRRSEAGLWDVATNSLNYDLGGLVSVAERVNAIVGEFMTGTRLSKL